MKPIQVTQSSMPSFEEYVAEIKDIWESRWLTNMGDKHKQLESQLAHYLNTPNVTLFTNGHLALESTVAAFNLTGEVITTPFTFASTTHAIVRNGLTPVFCDIHAEDYTIDVSKLEPLITEKTSAILPVHVYGNICNVREIETIAKKYHLKVIYDAAHAFGVTVDGEGVANFGDASMFSFHATKVFHTIEGGAVTYRESNLRKTLNEIKNFGITGPESVDIIGGNAKMNEFQAAMGICNLRNINREILRRKAVAERYLENLKDVKGIKLVQRQKGVKSNYAYFPVLFEDYKMSRDEVYALLKEHHIHARKYFYPLTNSLDCYQDRFEPGETPVANYIAERVLTLPLYPDLPIEDVDRICQMIIEGDPRERDHFLFSDKRENELIL
ncbi:DegT/DnrJ/EryC1/StrS family aminotransferase [Neobacillus notoginsengisoli]|uniref:DegT/DnrJ/EryC1/StrS family aminotransferase n=1 Tax=Neobacillus notoginsengisoli TaxID=1578198 RepID=A0A417YYT2_9BACI|nr:DegT/DnrJ/EryC1/StrS family aminotransferase [Neobacillus notoginsengisoli]RHW42795.1 DegT/DnrJ/EryC1/StrS family aminotransferase [Neobacillus notoginsengisoli]